MQRVAILHILGMAPIALPTDALAHAHLKRAEPRANATIKTAPAAVRLWFSEGLESTLSTVQVLNAAGVEIDRKDKHLDPKDNTVMEVSLPPLDAGIYTVRWHALSVDTHATDGTFTFTVAP